MAWLSSTSLNGGSTLTATLLNNLANDIRTWGGNVDAGGYTLLNASVRVGNGSNYFEFSRDIGTGFLFVTPSQSGFAGYRLKTKTAGGTVVSALCIDTDGKVGIQKTSPNTNFAVASLPTYADNTAALAGGLTAGDFYRTSSGAVMVTY